MRSLLKDLAYATRGLRSTPTFTLTAVLTLALGIGATTAIFSVANVVLLRALPYADADRLVTVWGELRNRNLNDFPFAPANFQDLRTDADAFQDLAAVTPGRQPLGGDGGPPEQVRVTGATANLFSLLGARVALGRDFRPEDAAPQAPPQGPPAPGAAPPQPLPASVILTHGFWQRRYGGDASVVGRTIEVGGNRAQVVGVLAPGFELLMPQAAGVEPVPDMYAAMRIDFASTQPGARINVFLRVVGRLKPGVALSRAQDQAERVAADLRQRFPIMNTAGLHIHVQPLHEDLVQQVRPAIVALGGAVAFVLLIACANVANLLLVRAAARERELAVRSALGGSPWRLVRQLLAESLVLAATGALVGLALAYGGLRLLVALAPANLPRLGEIRIDPAVLGFTALLALLAAALFGTVPALRASRPGLAQVLRAVGRASGGGRLLRSGVVAAEVALSFVLLVGGGLMVRSFVALMHADPGYDPTGVLTFQAAPLAPQQEARAAFMRQLRERLAALPGVQAVTGAGPFPLDGGLANARWGTAEAAADPAKFQQANLHVVLPGYFAALRTRLIAGRAFTDADDANDSSKTIVIDDLLAAKAFPHESAVGKRLLARIRSPEPEWLDVIGVVAHQRHEGLVAPGREAIFVTDGFVGHGGATRWAVRAAAGTDPERLVPAVRRVVAELDPRVPVAEVQPMQALVDRARGPTRFALVLIGVFGAIAAALAAVGLYGVLSTAVRQRTAEIGVRVAFGAPRASIFRLVIGEGLRLSALGVVVGLGAALLLTRVMGSLLVGITATDPATYAAIVVLFLGLAAASCWLPARRAAALDPTNALRGD